MLRPERMSKVSITGTRTVMGDVVDTIHDLNLLHISEYAGEFDGFEPGDPSGEAEAASERLVTVRSLESILEVEGEDVESPRIIEREDIDATLPEVRDTVNELDDRRSALEDELRSLEERIEAVEPFVELGLDLDLLEGYENIEVAVGEADPDAVEEAMAHRTDLRAWDIERGGDLVAVFAYPSEGVEDVLDDTLVGVEFTRVEVPDESGNPEDVLADLRRERETVDSKLDSVEEELADLRVEHGPFLLAAEEALTIEVQKAEAPLQFATTEHAFVAEGWLPTAEFTTLSERLREAVGDRIEIEELERASYTPTHGHESEAVADGGTVGSESPPVVQDNPSAARPFELLVETISKPLYWEIDPTVVLLLTFPLFYGFMIGDVAYGILYTLIGFWLWNSFESNALRSLGGIAMWSGAFTILFGFLYGEVFGFHFISTYFWKGALGMSHPPIEKGLHATEWAELWLVLSLIAGLLHLIVGFVFGFLNDAKAHGFTEAVLEDGSWLVLFVGMWTWVFSTQGANSKPEFLVGSGSVFNGNPIELGFTGLPPLVVAEIPIPAVGTLPLSLWLAVIVAGLVMVVAGEGVVGALESPNALVNVLSYTRIAIVLLAKAGMAFVVNLLVVGAYETPDHAVHFMYSGHAPADAEVIFGGLVHTGIAGVLVGTLVLVFGHLVVLALGVTSAGLQAVRLEYVEFFNKFYDGGGAKYEPFGHRRKYTTED
ncbi:MAG: V-type ATP synthase subunit I [Halobacteriaceae archaeon]